MRLGIMGGTFDPIHNAHLFIAEEARVFMGLEEVMFIPNGEPPHKKSYEVTSRDHRFAMAELATRHNKRFSVSRVEIEREGPSYAVDTLAALKLAHPAAQLFFISGFDAVAEILTWKRHKQVIRLCRLVAVARPGTAVGAAIETLPASYRERIDILESPHLDISSTELRDRVKNGLPIRYLVPDDVALYIREAGLYR
jgi:nicotinate-nucleotide adenylyltransferase